MQVGGIPKRKYIPSVRSMRASEISALVWRGGESQNTRLHLPFPVTISDVPLPLKFLNIAVAMPASLDWQPPLAAYYFDNNDSY
jgi:hypothetical protein